jgi:hypothetical protein
MIRNEKPLRTDVLGVPVDFVTMEDAVGFAEHQIESGGKGPIHPGGQSGKGHDFVEERVSAQHFCRRNAFDS